MKCQNCQFENREGVKFCEECGAIFELKCLVCKASIPLGRKFCGECGHKLDVPAETSPKEISFDEKLTKIQKYLPKGLTEKILAQRDRIEGERKQVTVMFCDMENFTGLSEKLGAEDAYAMMDRVYEILIHKDSELLYERGIYPRSTYVFKHALTQDSVYQSLLKSACQKYHVRIAQTLEKHFPEITSVNPAVMGRHFTEAGKIEQAIPYWREAGEIAIRRSAYIEAIGHLKNGLELLKALPGEPTPERIELELRLQVALGNALIATKGYADPEVGETFSCASELCLQEDKSPQLFQVLHCLARFHIVRTELQKTRDLGDQLLRWAKHRQDAVLFLSAHQLIGTALWFMGNFNIAQDQFEQGFSYYDPQQHKSYIDLTDEDQGVICLSYIAWNLWLLGFPDRSLKKCRKALTLAHKLSHPLSTVFAQSYAAILHIYRQEPLKVQEHAEAYGKAGNFESGLSVVAENLSEIRKNEERLGEAELYRVKGELLLMQGHAEAEAENFFKQGIEISKRQHAKSLELRSSISLSRLWQTQGKFKDAKRVLTEIYNWFDEGFDTADLKEARTLLGVLS